jgi:hypothetical protein
MPITLGCQSCGKRFRARDESAGKRVKCPYCAAPVSVPSAEESANASAPTAELPPSVPAKPPAPTKGSAPGGSGPVSPPSSRATPTPPQPIAPVASPDDWGASPPPAAPLQPTNPFVASAPPDEQPAANNLDFPKPGTKPTKGARGKMKTDPAPAASGRAKSPEQLAAPGWRKTRGGLFWVLFALLLLTIPGIVGFAKIVCERANVPLPHGKGFITIPGVVNDGDGVTFSMDADAQLDALAYGVPILLAGLMLSLGRMTCGSAPRSSGAKGMYAMSGLFTLVALSGLGIAAVCLKVLNYYAEVSIREIFAYAATGGLIAFLASEFWFLTALAASGSSLKRPKAARSVGTLGFFVALLAAAATIGKEQYLLHFRPKVTDDLLMYEQAALMLSWLLLIGLYWRAVRNVRAAIRDFLETVVDD